MLSLTISQGALALVVVVVAFGGTLLMLARIGRRAAHRSLDRARIAPSPSRAADPRLALNSQPLWNCRAIRHPSHTGRTASK